MNKEQMFLYLLKNDIYFLKYPKTYINLMKNENIKSRYLWVKEQGGLKCR